MSVYSSAYEYIFPFEDLRRAMINYNDDPNVNASHENKNHPNFQSAIVCFMKFLQKINKQQEDRLQQHLVHLNTDMTASMKLLINQQKLILERQESLHEKLQALETKFEDLERNLLKRNLLTQLFQTNNNETINEIDQACDIDLSTRPSVTSSENMEDDVFDPDAIESSQSYPTSTESNEGLLATESNEDLSARLSLLVQPEHTEDNSTHTDDIALATASLSIDTHESMDSELECEYDNLEEIDDELQDSEQKSTKDNFEDSDGDNQDFERESENDTIESVVDDNQESVVDENQESEYSPIQAQAAEAEAHSKDNPCSKIDALESQSESNHDLKVNATPQILMPNKKTVFSSFEDLKKSQNMDASTSLSQEQSTQIQSHTHVARSSSFPSIKMTFNHAHTSEIRHTYTENNYVEKVRNIPEGQKTLDDSKTDYRNIRKTFRDIIYNRKTKQRTKIDAMRCLEFAVGNYIVSTDQIRKILKDNGIEEKQFFSSLKFIKLNNQYWMTDRANRAKGNNYIDVRVRDTKYKLVNDSNTKTTGTSSNANTTESKTVSQSVKNNACRTPINPAKQKMLEKQKTLNDSGTDYNSILTSFNEFQKSSSYFDYYYNRSMPNNADSIQNFANAIKDKIFSLEEVKSQFTKYGFDIDRFYESKDFIKLNEEYWIAKFAAKGNYIDVRSKDDNS